MTTTRLPSLFASHGAPTVALHDEDSYATDLGRFGRALPKDCRAIAVMSAHWVHPGSIQVTSAPNPGLLYDFRGFQKELYAIEYPAPGSPAIAAEIQALLAEKKLASDLDPKRAFDHGVWVPLRFLRPEADLPVVQISIPMTYEPREIMQIGRALAPLREKGVFLLGSGGAVHNLRELQWHGKTGGADPRAVRFDTWLKRCLTEAKIEDLLNFRETAPDPDYAHPSLEHLMPLFFTMGSSLPGDRVRMVHEGFQYGSLSMLCFSLDPA